jgi:hypothetical protein
MKDLKSFDGDLEMFRETESTVNIEYLAFLRWLVERGRLEHLPACPPSGEFAESDAAWPLSEAA